MWESLVTWIIKAFFEMLYGVIKGAAGIEAALSKENSRLQKKVLELNESIASMEDLYERGVPISLEELDRLKDAGRDLNRTFF